MANGRDHVVVDVEIQKTIEEVGGWDRTDLMGVAVAVVYEERGDRFRVYGPGEVEALRARLLAADRVSGFNIASFDYPVIWGLARGQQSEGSRALGELMPKTNDLLRRIWQGLGFDPDKDGPKASGWKLDQVVRETLGGPGKIAEGAIAPIWWQKGEWSKVVNYCIDDVALERDLARFVDRRGYVVGAGGKVLRLKG